jgi:hypothetical protein
MKTSPTTVGLMAPTSAVPAVTPIASCLKPAFFPRDSLDVPALQTQQVEQGRICAAYDTAANISALDRARIADRVVRGIYLRVLLPVHPFLRLFWRLF